MTYSKEIGRHLANLIESFDMDEAYRGEERVSMHKPEKKKDPEYHVAATPDSIMGKFHMRYRDDPKDTPFRHDFQHEGHMQDHLTNRFGGRFANKVMKDIKAKGHSSNSDAPELRPKKK